MPVVFTILSLLLLYIRRFKKDFDDEQVTIFIAACVILIIGLILYIVATT